MGKKDIIRIPHQIENASQKVVQRFQVIQNPNDFTDTAAGMGKSKGDEGYYYTSLC